MDLTYASQRPGKYNDLATAFLANPDDTIKHIFSLGSLSPQAQVCTGLPVMVLDSGSVRLVQIILPLVADLLGSSSVQSSP